LGSGADKAADLERFNELEVIPEQEVEETECLDRIIYQGTPFESWVIRLKRINTSDPLKMAQVARTWSQVWFAQARELRAKAQLSGALSEDDKINTAAGQIMLMPFNQTPMTIENLLELSQKAAGMEAENPNAGSVIEDQEKPTDTTEEKQRKRARRFIRYLKREYNVSAAEFVEHALPKIQEFVESRATQEA
jgi:hypothetical protein